MARSMEVSCEESRNCHLVSSYLHDESLLSLGTDSSTDRSSPYQFSIQPFPAHRDHQDMHISVRSLVSIFEHDHETTIDIGLDESCTDLDVDPIPGDGSSFEWQPNRDPKKLPDLVQCSEVSETRATSTPTSANTSLNTIKSQHWAKGSDSDTSIDSRKAKSPLWVKDKSQLNKMQVKPSKTSVLSNHTFIQALIEAMDNKQKKGQKNKKSTPPKPARNKLSRTSSTDDTDPSYQNIDHVTDHDSSDSPPKHDLSEDEVRPSGDVKSKKNMFEIEKSVTSKPLKKTASNKKNSNNNYDSLRSEDVQTRIERWSRVSSLTDSDFSDSDLEEFQPDPIPKSAAGVTNGGAETVNIINIESRPWLHEKGVYGRDAKSAQLHMTNTKFNQLFGNDKLVRVNKIANESLTKADRFGSGKLWCGNDGAPLETKLKTAEKQNMRIGVSKARVDDLPTTGSSYPSPSFKNRRQVEVIIEEPSHGRMCSWDVQNGVIVSPASSSTSLASDKEGDEGGLSPDSNDAELDAIQNSSPNLNNEASKQKVILRQKGSLAKRRKPSRNSLRVQSADCDHYADALADELDQSRSNEDLSADEKGDRCKDGEEEDGGEKSEEDGETGKVEMHAHEEEERQAAVTSPPPDPVLLPGLGQTVKLKKSKSVSDAEPATGSSQSEVIDLSKIHLRKTHSVDTPTPTTGSDSAAPGDDEENQSNTFGAQPDWLKEARAKKKRVAEKFTEEADKKDKVGEDDPGPSPWLKDRKLRKVTAPTPFKVYSNVEESQILTATSHSLKASTPAKAPHVHQKTEVKHTDNPDKQLKHSINESVKSGEKEIIIRKDLASREVVITSKQPVKSPPPSVHTDMHVDNQHTPEAPSSKVSSPAVMSPTSVSPPESAEQSHGVTPSWKLEIENRKKTKYFVPSQKPKAPLRLGETPQWKRDLMERNKQRSKHSSPGPDDITTEIGWKKGDTSDEADGKS